MSPCRVPTGPGPQFGESPTFPVLQYVPEYVNYLDSRHSAAIHKSGVALTMRDGNNIT